MQMNVSATPGLIYASSPVGVTSSSSVIYSQVSLFSAVCLLLVAHCNAVKGEMVSLGEEYNRQTQDELECQKMSNETNEVLTNVQNEVSEENDPNITATLPEDVVDFINENAIVITGVTDGGSGGTFSPISTSTEFNEGQLQAIKGQFDIMSTAYSDSNSKYQLGLQVTLQTLSQGITAISQTMAKSNQVISQIVSNLK
jgi:EspA-like secreted protein